MLNNAFIEDARGRLIVALDLPSVVEASALVDALGDTVTFYKVGLGLQLGGGDRFARDLKQRGKRVFLDYKYYDIEATVQNAVARAAEMDIDFLTVHGVTGILKSAVAGRGNSNLKVLCVTVLTSMDAGDIAEMGFPPSVAVEDLVLHRAKKALDIGVDGVISSALEVSQIKQQTEGKLMVVTPGIRPAGKDAGDQKRVSTPGAAIKAGADYLVIGRAITQDKDPKAMAEKIVLEMAEALAER
ncbi:MAG: orotidine-5'-phosphate decarboxylase [Pseudomonadota bacterium]